MFISKAAVIAAALVASPFLGIEARRGEPESRKLKKAGKTHTSSPTPNPTPPEVYTRTFELDFDDVLRHAYVVGAHNGEVTYYGRKLGRDVDELRSEFSDSEDWGSPGWKLILLNNNDNYKISISCESLIGTSTTPFKSIYRDEEGLQVFCKVSLCETTADADTLKDPMCLGCGVYELTASAEYDQQFLDNVFKLFYFYQSDSSDGSATLSEDESGNVFPEIPELLLSQSSGTGVTFYGAQSFMRIFPDITFDGPRKSDPYNYIFNMKVELVFTNVNEAAENLRIDSNMAISAKLDRRICESRCGLNIGDSDVSADLADDQCFTIPRSP